MKFMEADKNRLVAALNREKIDRVPIFEHAIDNRYIQYALGLEKLTSLNMEPEDHLRLMGHIGMDVATIGYKWTVKGLDTWDKLGKVQEPDFSRLLQSVDRYLSVLKGSNVGLNVYVHGPLDLTYMSMGYENFFYAVHDDIDLVDAIMDLFAWHSTKVVGELVKRGIDMIYLPDDIAFGQGLMIKPEILKKLWVPKMERILQSVYQSKLPYVYHSDGKTDEFLPIIIDLGFKGITAIEPQCNDIFEIKKKYGTAITLFGNMDIAGSLAFGTREEVVRDVKMLLEGLMPGGGYVAMSANSISNGVIPENYQAMIDTVKQFGRYV